MPERIVRFTAQFFERIDELLPETRGADGSPSVTDFLLLQLPSIRDALAVNFEGSTLTTEDPEIRVYIGAGVLVARVAVYAAIESDGAVEAFWIEFDQ